MLECRAEEFSLTSGRDTRNKNDHSRVQRFRSMEGKKIGSIVRYKRIVLLANGDHQLPVS